MRRFSRFGLGSITAVTMGIATFPQVIFSVLAAEIIVELGVERWQVGALVTATGVTGALLSPTLGRLTDGLGAARSMQGILLGGIAGLGLIAVSPTYLVLAAAAILTGAPQGWCNPATNALIVENTTVGARGVITGVKQSGVQMGTFLGGLLLPVLTAFWNWRVAVLWFLVFPVGGVIAMARRSTTAEPVPASPRGYRDVPITVKWIAVYGTISGLATSAIFTFLPLFAEEAEGWSGTQAGWLLAGVGLVGVIARIVWGSAAEARLGHGRALEMIALMATVSAVMLAGAATDLVSSWVLIPAAILFASGGIAWNAVGMLAVMDLSPAGLVGRGTGLVLLGFLLGVGAGAPLMGLSVDRLGVYGPGWVGVAVLFFICAVVAGKIHRTGTLAPS